MVCAHPNNGGRRAFQYGDMQQMWRPAFDRRLLDPGMRSHSLGKKRWADLMEPHAGIQDEPLQYFRLRHVVNTLNLYLADFQPALQNRPHPSRDHGQPPSQRRKTDDPLPHAQRTSPSRDESLPTRLLPLIRDLTGTRALPLVQPRADCRHFSLPQNHLHGMLPTPDGRSRRAARTMADSRIRSVSLS